MILVTVGTSSTPFDRLVNAAGSLGSAEPVVVQHGASAVRPPAARCVETLPAEELASLMAEARAVVTHAGVGSVLTALSAGRKPVVVPRLAAEREAVDDHQLELGRRLEQLGLVTLVEDVADLPAAVATAAGGVERPRAKGLAKDLRAYLERCVGAAAASSSAGG